jgi:serine/threonine protein kinase
LNAALEGRYRIERQLGEGGMATVYLARDEKHNRHVALKVLKPELAAAIGSERFLQEIEVTAKLHHPHILPLHDSGEASGFLYYVMPYVDGESLNERIDRERELPVDESVRIAKDLATALDYAHRQGIIHRDIKPSNVLLQDGQPLIADFGIAIAITAAAGDRLTATGLSIGTPRYMSPEQAAADRPVDGRSDVYSLACVLFEMLAGEPPFTGSNPGALLARKLTDTAPDVSTVRETVPWPVAHALRRALSRTPADRFQTAADFARALDDRTGAAMAAEAQAADTGPGTRAAARRGRWGLALASMAVGALAVAAAATVLRSGEDRTPAVALSIFRGVSNCREGSGRRSRFRRTAPTSPTWPVTRSTGGSI